MPQDIHENIEPPANPKTGIFAWFRGAGKRDKFLAILALLAISGTILSLLARETFVPKDDSNSIRLAVVAPLTGPNEEIGRSMSQGATFLVEQLNRAGGLAGSTVVLERFDDQDDPAQARRIAQSIAERGDILAVVGHWSPEVSLATAPIYQAAGIPTIVPSSAWPELVENNDFLFATVFDARSEARFMANYARNVVGHRLMSMVVESSDYGAALAQEFEETFKRFGAPPQFRWTFDINAPDRKAEIARLVAEYKAHRDEAGALFLAATELNAPDIIKAFRDNGLRTVWFGPSRLATGAFAQSFQGRAAKGDLPANYTNDMTVAAPLLFDTANEAAQNFRVSYSQRFGVSPDWVASYTHDAVKLVTDIARQAQIQGGASDMDPARLQVRNALAATTIAQAGIRGVTGQIAFSETGASEAPVQIGIFNGDKLISALTQLQPIPRGAVSNYIEELKQGRVLYVNDRFMYKTNVVYTGLQMTEIAELDLETENAKLEFLLWFRFRGEFDPQDVIFTNAAEPVTLDAPIDEYKVGDMTYRLYRVTGEFTMNFSGAKRLYGSHIAGLAFRHRTLNRNNLLYVVDVLGMPSGESLKERLVSDKVVPPGLGWAIDRAWVSQEVTPEDAMGAPKYVGHGGIDPDFSKLDTGIVIKKDGLSARDVIPSEWFIYVAIFGVLASVFAVLMDGKKMGRFWAYHSYGLRLVFWPLLLLAGGNLILDFAYQNLPLANVYTAVTTYDALWWLVPARLAAMAVKRFIWVPLEDRTGRKIPNVVKMFAAFVIYMLAILGVIAFVFNEPITSLLATSGLLAMIIGLAIQANISNIFSGIVLNMERPFTVGDWVKLGATEDALVTDITWRTTRLLTRSGMTVAIPNAKASESQIINYSIQGKSRVTINLYVDTAFPTEMVRHTLRDAPLDVPGVLADPAPAVYFDGIVNADGEWLAQYSVHYWITDYSGKTATSGRVWDAVYGRLENADIPLGSASGRDAERRRSSSQDGPRLRMGVDGEDEKLDRRIEDKPEWEVVENDLEDRLGL